MTTRQVQLRRGSAMLDLSAAPYALVAGSWTSMPAVLELRVLVQATTLAELDRHVGILQRWLTLAQTCDQLLLGDWPYVWQKTCDDISTVAELGATWQIKKLTSGSLVMADPSESADGRYVIQCALTLNVETEWRRAAPESALETLTAPTERADGGITTAAALVGRRITWTSTTGVTIRYRWLAAAAAADFFKISGTTVKAQWDHSNRRFKMQDNAGTPVVAQSAQYSFAVGDEVDVIFRWSPGAGMAIWVNGVASGSAASCTFAQADVYTVFEPTGSQSVLGVQVWPAPLTDAECAGLYAWGRPEAELMVVKPPPNTRNMNGVYLVYNCPGSALAPLRLVLDGDTQDYTNVRVGLRPLRALSVTLRECEAGTLGAHTAAAADASASDGNVARVTPADASWATRVTLVLAADPDDVAAIAGEHRLLLACLDGATAVQINRIRWRLVIAGQAEDWSDEISAAAIGTYSLLDLGTMRVPAGQWPVESLRATTDVHAGSYVTLEIQSQNIAGSGGGTLDLDALTLQPAEMEGTLSLTIDVSAWYALLDSTGVQPVAIGVADPRSMEFAAWGTYPGASLRLTPTTGEAGTLICRWYRDTLEQAYMLDLCDVFVFVEPRWV